MEAFEEPGHGRSTARERALGVWLHRRRQDAAAGTLSPAYQALNVIPDWDKQPTQSEVNAARWDRRMAELAAHRAAGNNRPLHKKAATEQERILGVWLHSQRINHRNETLNPAKEAQLDASLCLAGAKAGHEAADAGLSALRQGH
ncbi:UNVERIFIED_ORG: hypothetical protein ABIB19_003223 [Arthrobacter sp. UYEF10]